MAQDGDAIKLLAADVQGRPTPWVFGIDLDDRTAEGREDLTVRQKRDGVEFGSASWDVRPHVTPGYGMPTWAYLPDVPGGPQFSALEASRDARQADHDQGRDRR